MEKTVELPVLIICRFALAKNEFHECDIAWVVSLYRVHSLFGRTKAFILSRIRLRKLALTRYRDTTRNPAGKVRVPDLRQHPARAWQPSTIPSAIPLAPR